MVDLSAEDCSFGSRLALLWVRVSLGKSLIPTLLLVVVGWPSVCECLFEWTCSLQSPWRSKQTLQYLRILPFNNPICHTTEVIPGFAGWHNIVSKCTTHVSTNLQIKNRLLKAANFSSNQNVWFNHPPPPINKNKIEHWKQICFWVKKKIKNQT